MDWKSYFTSPILRRGIGYQKSGLVKNVEQIDGKYYADVVGSETYQVSIWKAANYRLGMSCTCPYAQDGNKCKHMAALCTELSDVLESSIWNQLQPQKPKVENSRIYPFTKRNVKGDKEYVYFDLDEMTKNIVIKQKDLDEAKKVIEKNEIFLKDVEIGYRELYTGKMILGGTITVICNNAPVTIHFSEEEVFSASCAVAKCNNYFSYNYYYGRNHLCKHQLAALLLFEEYINKYNPGDNTNYEAKLLMRRYQQMNRNQVVETVSGSVEDLQLEPKIDKKGTAIHLSFRVGIAKLFVIKNLTEFVQNIEEKRIQKFGTKTEIDFNIHKIHPDSGEYYSYLKKIVKEQERRLEAGDFASYGEEKIGGSILLYGRRLDEFFELLLENNTTVVYIDKFSSEKNQFLSVREKNPKIELKILAIHDKNKIFKGVTVSGELPKMLRGENSYYYIEEPYLNRMDENATEVLEPLFEMAEGNRIEFEVGRKSLSDFYYHVMPLLSEYVDFIEEKRKMIDTYLPPKAEFLFYLDAEEKEVSCDAKVRYGDETYSLAERMDKVVEVGNAQDVNAEAEALFHVQRYFNEVDKKRKLFLCSDNEEAAYTVLEKGMNELLKVGDVFCTDRFKNIRVHKKTPLSVGISLESGLMNLEISSEEYSNQELLEILASYRRKKKYHRLKNGDFINIEDENLEMITGMLDTLHISVKEFLKGKTQIPAYRALYLDKLLEKNESLYIERDKNFKALIKEFKTVEDSDFELPQTLQKIMRNYQTTGYRWLRTLQMYGFGGILADDMGLGKTLQVISVLQAAKEEGKNGTSLIVSPASLIYNWQEEFKKFAPDINALVVSGTQADRAALLKEYQTYDVLITSYDLLKRDIAEYEEKQFLFQIVDEAQYIKNHTTAVAKSVKCIRSETKYALTGTPIENRLSELWSIFDYLMPGFLYGYETFKKEIERPIAKNQDSNASERLKKMVSPFILRRLKEDVLKDLPEKLEEVQYAQFEAKQQQIYDGQVVHMKEMLAKQSKEEFSQNKIQVLAELTKLRQICCDPALLFEDYHGESAKRQACMDLIKRAIEGEHRILLFSQFTSMLSLLEESLKKEGIEYYKITGSTSKEERIRLVKEFNEGKVPVFLISLKAGGTGLNLTGADVVIHYDPWWNQAVQNQATDRAHRIGQKKVVTVYKLIMKGSIEEKIVHLQEAKKNLADEILSGENGGLGQMTKEELLELL